MAALLIGVAPTSALADGRVYVASNSGGSQPSGSVWQYEFGTDGALRPLSPASVPSGRMAGGVAISPDGGSVYVSNGGAAAPTISQYTVRSSGTLVPKSPATVPLSRHATHLAVTPDGKYLFTASGGAIAQFEIMADGSLTANSPASVPVIAYAIAIAPDSKSLYAGSGQTVSQFDITAHGTLAPKSAPSVPGAAAHGIAVSPDGTSLYTADGSNQYAIYQYDIGAGGNLTAKSPASVSTSKPPHALAISPEGESLYGASYGDWGSQGAGYATQYTVGPGGVLAPKSPEAVPTGPIPNALAVSPDGGSVYVSSTGDGAIYQYDAHEGLIPKSPASVAAGGASFDLVVTDVTPPPNPCPVDPPTTTVAGMVYGVGATLTSNGLAPAGSTMQQLSCSLGI